MASKAASSPVDTQDATESSPEVLYEVNGDTARALEAYPAASKEQNSLSQEYNRMLLTYLSSSSSDDLVTQLDEWNAKLKFQRSGDKKQDFILAYNRSLVLYASGKPREAAAPLIELLRPLVEKQSSFSNDLLDASSRAALLVLDCILAVSDATGLHQLDDTLTSAAIVTWLDSLDFESKPDLKFLLALYKTRLDVAARDNHGKMIDSKVRGVRKELKQAMEVLNRKLKGETASSVAENSLEDSAGSFHGSSIRQQQPPRNPQEAMLQGLSQSALNLKAHWEELKGNSKKSLVLCAEALASSDDETYESIHSNNLAIVHACSGKRHLAMHSASRSLQSSMTSSTPLFLKDGRARPDCTFAILHNAAIVALKGCNYMSAYECMAHCVQNSKEYADRPRCWLRMAEACLGLYGENKKRQEKKESQSPFFSAVTRKGKSQGVLVRPNALNSPPFAPQDLPKEVGTQEDLAHVAMQPLGRAYTCLEQVVGFYKENQNSKDDDKDCLESARCSLAFIKLEVRDYQGSSDLSMSLLLDSETDPFWKQQDPSSLNHRLHKRRLACARLYAAEALSALGKPDSAMHILAREDDQRTTCLNDLSVDLCGGILPDINVDDVSKLLQAQVVVKSNASSVATLMKDNAVAQELAMSAVQTSEQDKSGSSSVAQKARLYCMLQEGNRKGALETLGSTVR